MFRVMQGIGGGALLPMSMAINYRNFPPNERSKVTAILGIPLVIAPAFGPTIGGYLSTSLNWNAVFLINVPLGIIDLLLAFLILPGRTSSQNELAKGARKSFDILGLLLSLAGVTTLVYGISVAGTKGWGDQTVPTTLVIGAAVLIIFIVVELRVSDPVLDLRLFLNYTFTIANVLIWLIIGVSTGGLFLIPFFLENARGDTALTVGVFLIGQSLATAVGITTSGNLYNRVGPRILVVCGLLFLVGGTYGLTQINVNTTGQDMQVWLLLRGLGLGLVYQPLHTLALSVVSNKGMAKASSLVNVTRQVTSAIAVVALTTYLTEQTVTHGVGLQAIAAGMADTFWVVLILGIVCIPPALIIGRDPAIEAIKKAQQAKASKALAQESKGERPAEHLLVPQPPHVPAAPIRSIPNVILTLTANGEEIMGPETLLLIQHMPYRSHTLGIQDVNAYAGPVIEEAINQLVRITPLGPVGSELASNQRLQMRQDLSQLVYQHLQPFLSSYGITLDTVKVQGLRPRDEHIKALISLKAFGLSELDAVRYYTAITKNTTDHRIREQDQKLEQNLYMIWRKTLDRYADEIATLQAELESTRADMDLRMDAHSAHLQKLSHAISNDLQAIAPILEITPLPEL